MPSSAQHTERSEKTMDRKARTKHHILQTAAGLFADQEPDATTIDDIVNTAGVAKGTFYNYFEDRPAVQRLIAAEIRRKLTASVKQMNANIADPAERVARGLKLYLSLAYIDPVSARILARLYNTPSTNKRPVDKPLISDLAAGIEAGRFNVPTVEVALHLVLGLSLIGMQHLLTHGAGEEVLRGEGYAQEATRTLLQGLGMKKRDIDRVLLKPFSFDPTIFVR